MTAITRIAAMMVDHLFVAVLADLPPKPIFAIARKRWLVTRAFGVSSLRTADQIGRNDLFPAELATIHVQVEPPAKIRNAHENSTCRLHVLVGLFKPAADHLTSIGRIGVDDIRRRDLEFFGARL